MKRASSHLKKYPRMQIPEGLCDSLGYFLCSASHSVNGTPCMTLCKCKSGKRWSSAAATSMQHAKMRHCWKCVGAPPARVGNSPHIGLSATDRIQTGSRCRTTPTLQGDSPHLFGITEWVDATRQDAALLEVCGCAAGQGGQLTPPWP